MQAAIYGKHAEFTEQITEGKEEMLECTETVQKGSTIPQEEEPYF